MQDGQDTTSPMLGTKDSSVDLFLRFEAALVALDAVVEALIADVDVVGAAVVVVGGATQGRSSTLPVPSLNTPAGFLQK